MQHRIKEVRKEKGMKQSELAEKLGITRQGVSSIENSDSVTLNTLEKVANALGCYVHELIEATETANGFLAFNSPEEFDAYRQSILKNIDDVEHSKLDMLIENASRLNDTGVMLLTAISHVLSTAEELTKSGMAINYEDELTNGK